MPGVRDLGRSGHEPIRRTVDRTRAAFLHERRAAGPTAAISGVEFESALYDRRVQLHLESVRHPPTFILGRRGSGKTALLLSRELDRESLTIRLSTPESFSQINSALDYLNERVVVTVESAAEIWDLILWGPIYVQLATTEATRDPKDEHRIIWEGTKELRKVASGAPDRMTRS